MRQSAAAVAAPQRAIGVLASARRAPQPSVAIEAMCAESSGVVLGTQAPAPGVFSTSSRFGSPFSAQLRIVAKPDASNDGRFPAGMPAALLKAA